MPVLHQRRCWSQTRVYVGRQCVRHNGACMCTHPFMPKCVRKYPHHHWTAEPVALEGHEERATIYHIGGRNDHALRAPSFCMALTSIVGRPKRNDFFQDAVSRFQEASEAQESQKVTWASGPACQQLLFLAQ